MLESMWEQAESERDSLAWWSSGSTLASNCRRLVRSARTVDSAVERCATAEPRGATRELRARTTRSDARRPRIDDGWGTTASFWRNLWKMRRTSSRSTPNSQDSAAKDASIRAALAVAAGDASRHASAPWSPDGASASPMSTSCVALASEPVVSVPDERAATLRCRSIQPSSASRSSSLMACTHRCGAAASWDHLNIRGPSASRSTEPTTDMMTMYNLDATEMKLITWRPCPADKEKKFSWCGTCPIAPWIVALGSEARKQNTASGKAHARFASWQLLQ
mmetsp:Transcript_100838/g.308297  ORF Transcript_100838/g.308297 Transcript_100838/m.308297 type:complete len:279 (+) Transcript_100838:172-1008(+)